MAKYKDDFSDRHLYLGASEVAAAIGKSKWTGRYELFCQKTRRTGREHKKIFDRGHDMEPVMVDLLKRDHGITVISQQKEFVCPSHPFIVSHVDGIIPEYQPITDAEDIGASGPGVLEMKAPGSNRVRSLQTHGLDTDYIIQMQINLFNAGMTWGRFVFLDYDNYELVMFDVARNDKLISAVLPLAEDFWSTVQLSEYDDGGRDDDAEEIEIPHVGNKEIAFEPGESDEAVLVESLIEAKTAYDAAKAGYDVAKDAVKSLLYVSSAKSASVSGVGRVTAVYSKPREVIDGKGLMVWATVFAQAVADGDPSVNKMAEAFLSENRFSKTSSGSVSIRVKEDSGE